LHYFVHSAIALLDAFAKNVKEDVDKQELRAWMQTAEEIRKELEL
jgi:hypothetical protein